MFGHFEIGCLNPVEQTLALCGLQGLAPSCVAMLHPGYADPAQKRYFYTASGWADLQGTSFSGASGTRVEMYDTSGASALPLLLLYFNTTLTAGQITTLTGTGFKTSISTIAGVSLANVNAISITPPDYANMVGWWDASWATSLANNDPVGSLYDKGYLGSTLQQVGAASLKPTHKTNQINGLPAVYFDGGDYLINDALAAYFTGEDKPSTAILVLKRVYKSRNEYVLGMSNNVLTNSRYHPIYYASTGNNALKGLRDDDAGNLITSSTYVVEDTTLAHMSCFGYGPTYWSIWCNGALKRDKTAQDVGTITLDNYSMGTYRLAGVVDPVCLQGYVAECMHWKSELSGAQRQVAETYLFAKWGITPS